MKTATLSPVGTDFVLVTTGDEAMAKKQIKVSEARKHPAMLRVTDEALEQAKLAASLMKKSLADYVSDLIVRYATQDVTREARKLAGGGRE